MSKEQLNTSSILDGVSELYERTVYLPDTGLPEPPAGLIRRFTFEYVHTPDGPVAMIDEDVFPEELSYRWWNAISFRNDIFTAQQPGGWVDRETYDFWQTPCDPETLECTLTPDDIYDFFLFATPFAIEPDDEELAEFDLHDVYVAMEATLLERYHWRENFESESVDALSNGRYIKQVESILHVLGQALA